MNLKAKPIKNIDILNFVRPNILKLKPYVSAKNEFNDLNKISIFLDANENPYKNGLNRYPDPNQIKLKSILSKIKSIATENILLGNGSDEILDLIFRAFCEPAKDNVIVNIPTFGMYKVLADINNVSCKKVFLKENFQLDVKNILQHIDKNTKLIFICSPNNPTGNIMGKEDILSLVKNSNALIVIDEAYIDFTNLNSWIDEVNNFDNLIITQTLSKAYGMAGIRLGICYTNPTIIEILQKIKMPYSVSKMTQQKAIERLNNSSLVKQEIRDILQNKLTLSEELLKIDFVEKIYDSVTNFLLIKVDNANKRYSQLIEKGIVVRNRTNEPLCENCLRITIGTDDEVEQLINTFKLLN